ncbi:MAG: FAD-binding protein, partial [Chitinophagaceae bacterium]
MVNYDYVIVGAGLFGATFAHQAKQAGKRCLVIDKRPHSGGNIYCQNVDGINVHYYGAHIFHTNDRPIWDFVNSFVEFNRYTNSPVANHEGKLYNLPFNMNTFYQLWGVITPDEAQAKIQEQIATLGITHPKNLEEQALMLVGTDIYEKLIKGYTEKQWGRKATELPAFIIKRLPVRFTFDNNYFNDKYQGIPIGGYNKLAEGLLEGIEVRLDTNFFDDPEYFRSLGENLVYTGQLDEYYNYRFGPLEYRSLRFEHKHLEQANYQGNAVVNYTE